MGLQHDALPRAIGRLRARAATGEVYGTCFLIGPTRALTCAHCLRGVDGDKLERGTITFSQIRGAPVIPFEAIYDRLDLNAGIDVAVLKIPAPVAGSASLTLSSGDISALTAWQSFGHPAAIDFTPLWLGGTVDGPIARKSGDMEGWLLSLHVDGDLAPLDGMSGSPVVTEQGVIGLLSHQLYRKGDAKQGPSPAFNKTFAVATRFLLSVPSFTNTLRIASNVFIAYRRNSREGTLVAELSAALKKAGHNAFYDLDLDVGDDWAVRLRETLMRAHAFVPVLTEESVESPMLVNEIKMAYRQWRYTGRPIVLPIRDPALASLPFELETYLGQLQYAAWTSESQTSSTVKAILEAVDRQVTDVLPDSSSATASPKSGELSQASAVRIRAASSALPLTDPFYATRPGDREAFDRIEGDKFSLTILAPSGFGKTSLAIRLKQRCAQVGRETIAVDFQGFGTLPKDDDGVRSGYVSFLNDFARSLCRSVKGMKVPVPSQPLADSFDLEVLLRHLLETMPRLVLILDGADRLIAREYGLAFFQQCRSWLDDTTMQISFIFCISTEPTFLIPDANSSPFNIDKDPIELPPFDTKMLRTLVSKCKFDLHAVDLETLKTVTGGHPLFTRQALVQLFAPRTTDGGDVVAATKEEVRARLAEVESNCGNINGGPFSASLRSLLSMLERSKTPPAPLEVLRAVIKKGRAFKASPSEDRVLRRLAALGVIRQVRDVVPRYEILNLAYARFICERP